jgi:hypothetical protein
MAIEQFANNARTTLASGMDGSQTTLSVTSATGFPSVGQFRIIIENEILLVTGVSGTTFTVTRGAESTSAASHSSGVSVTHIITKGSLDKRVEDECLVDTFANRPTAGKAGRLFLPSDGNVLYRDTGAEWRGLCLGHYMKSPPVLSNWAWINQGTATAVDEAGTIRLTAIANNGLDAKILKKSAPSTPYTITAAFEYYISNLGVVQQGGSFGLCWRQSSDGKLILNAHRIATNGGTFSPWSLFSEDWNSATSRSAANFTQTTSNAMPHFRPNLLWVRITDNGTNRIVYFSFDGLVWFQMLSETRTTFLTGDEVGFFINNDWGGQSGNSVFDNYIRLVHWEES